MESQAERERSLFAARSTARIRSKLTRAFHSGPLRPGAGRAPASWQRALELRSRSHPRAPRESLNGIEEQVRLI